MENLDGKVIIVTGASGGIGRASAILFAQKGATVAAADIQTDQRAETVRMIKDQRGDAFFVKTDVTKSADVQALINKTVEVYGRLDYALNNADIGGANALTADYSEKDWNRIIGINLTGVFLCMKYEIPQMLKLGKGVIVITASTCGLTALTWVCGYDAAKHGVVGLIFFDKTLIFDGWSIGGLFWLVKKYFVKYFVDILHRKAGSGRPGDLLFRLALGQAPIF